MTPLKLDLKGKKTKRREAHWDISPSPRSSLLLAKPTPTFRERLFRKLQDHVFNRLPIRLLHFESTGSDDSSLQIYLMERGQIYSKIVEIMDANIDEVNLRQDGGDEAIEQIVQESTGYAILSHTWLRNVLDFHWHPLQD
ncbi:hypothetical protein BDN70DRAFT_938545 [Pholiota conissans]|uniref:Uncharacterized protein n=1 Tax=Pholiota conissans TaxID=109636 RepID=A0A9P5YN23_9AGAR|nr:hypothetical protein BDN70DRAFT_938545 [Pholiota conissans]